MPRRFTIAAVVSLFLTVGTVVLWVVAGSQQEPPSVLRYGVAAIMLVGALAVAVTPFLWLGAHLAEGDRRRRIAQGRCPSCGYNLTGNASGVCPECGTPVRRQAT